MTAASPEKRPGADLVSGWGCGTADKEGRPIGAALSLERDNGVCAANGKDTEVSFLLSWYDMFRAVSFRLSPKGAPIRGPYGGGVGGSGTGLKGGVPCLSRA